MAGATGGQIAMATDVAYPEVTPWLHHLRTNSRQQRVDLLQSPPWESPLSRGRRHIASRAASGRPLFLVQHHRAPGCRLSASSRGHRNATHVHIDHTTMTESHPVRPSKHSATTEFAVTCAATRTPHTRVATATAPLLAKALRPARAHRSTGLSRASLQLRASRSITMSRVARWQTRKALVVNCSGNCYSTACHVPARGTGGELPRRGIRTFPWPISQKRSALLYVTTLTLRDVRPADQDGDATWKPDGWLASSNTATRRYSTGTSGA